MKRAARQDKAADGAGPTREQSGELESDEHWWISDQELGARGPTRDTARLRRGRGEWIATNGVGSGSRGHR